MQVIRFPRLAIRAALRRSLEQARAEKASRADPRRYPIEAFMGRVRIVQFIVAAVLALYLLSLWLAA